ncbi:hypothetical protein RYX36_005389 [Vicia faba]
MRAGNYITPESSTDLDLLQSTIPRIHTVGVSAAVESRSDYPDFNGFLKSQYALKFGRLGLIQLPLTCRLCRLLNAANLNPSFRGRMKQNLFLFLFCSITMYELIPHLIQSNCLCFKSVYGKCS